MKFDRFIGVDYSGAKTPQSRLPGLRVFEARPDGEPMEMRAGNGTSRNWSREELAHWLRHRLQERTLTIVGIDHAFSFPENYFEKYGLANWTQFLEDFCAHWPTDAPQCRVDSVRDGTWWRSAKKPPGKRVGENGWFRRCERCTSSAKSVFQFDVQGQVAKSTHAGLPWLRWLRNELGERVHWWPFDGWDVPAAKHVVAEVYPAIFRNRYERDDRNPDQHDAYAVTRWLEENQRRNSLARYFSPPLAGNEFDLASREGWILGVS